MKLLSVCCWALLLLVAGLWVNADELPAYLDPESGRPSEVLELWPDGMPGERSDIEAQEVYPGGVRRVLVPKLHAYPLEGAEDAPAVVIFPGGGYEHIAMEKEGHAVARWLNTLGFAAFVVEYRHAPYRAPYPLMDAQRAFRMVRANAEQWGVDPERIGVMGGSAGGHLAACVLTMWREPLMQEGPYAGVSCRPDFGILAYPVISLVDESVAHQGSRYNLLGPDQPQKLREVWSPELHVPENMPPILIYYAEDDGEVNPGNSLLFQQCVEARGGSVTVVALEEGGHGFGLYQAEAVEACEAWLEGMESP